MLNPNLNSSIDLIVNPGRWRRALNCIPFVDGVVTCACTRKVMRVLDAVEAAGFSSADRQQVENLVPKLQTLSVKIKKSRWISSKKRHGLDRRIIALCARGGITQCTTLPADIIRLLGIAGASYKQRTFAISDKEWSEQDGEKIAEIVERYPAFARHLLENKKLQQPLFEWIVLHSLPADIFIKYVTVTSRIPHLAIQHLATACPGALAETVEDENCTKLTLKCQVLDESEDYHVFNANVLDRLATIWFSPEKEATMEQVLKQFPKESSARREYQFFEDGLYFWKTSTYNDVDFSDPEWWEQLPVFKTLSLEEAKNRYHQDVDGFSWVMSPRSVHKGDSLSLSDTHAYLEVAIPREGGNGYLVYPFGRNPEKDPFTVVQILKFLGKTTFGRIIYADQGAYYTERRNKGVVFVLTPQKGLELMGIIQEDIQQGLSNKIPFQLSWENCAKWVQDVVGRIAPDQAPSLYEIRMKDVKTPLSKGPKILKQVFVTALGGHRKKKIGDVYHSVARSPFFKDFKIHHPTYLSHKVHLRGMTRFYSLG